MCIDDLQKRLINGMIKLYIDDYEGCLAGDYNTFPIWNGTGDRYFNFLTDRTVYDTEPNKSYVAQGELRLDPFKFAQQKLGDRCDQEWRA